MSVETVDLGKKLPLVADTVPAEPTRAFEVHPLSGIPIPDKLSERQKMHKFKLVSISTFLCMAPPTYVIKQKIGMTNKSQS